MRLPNKVYDVLKYLLIIFVPALIVLVSKLDIIWGFGADKVIETIAAVAVFLGAILGISCYNYNIEQKVSQQNTYNEDAFLEMMDYEEEDYEDQNDTAEE